MDDPRALFAFLNFAVASSGRYLYGQVSEAYEQVSEVYRLLYIYGQISWAGLSRYSKGDIGAEYRVPFISTNCILYERRDSCFLRP